jgi:hypothetical protein
VFTINSDASYTCLRDGRVAKCKQNKEDYVGNGSSTPIFPGNIHGLPLLMPMGCPVCIVIAHFTLSLFFVLLHNLFYEILSEKLPTAYFPDTHLSHRAEIEPILRDMKQEI